MIGKLALSFLIMAVSNASPSDYLPLSLWKDADSTCVQIQDAPVADDIMLLAGPDKSHPKQQSLV